MNDTETKLFTLLNSYGDIIKLNWNFDSDAIINNLKKEDWLERPNNKLGLNLTGGDGKDLGLESKDKHNVDQPYTQALLNNPELKEFFDKWEKLARCRAAWLNEGSFFRLHRDAWRMNPQMRIFIPLNKTDIHEWTFIYNEERVPFEAGKAYILNTRKQHGSFTMVNGVFHILMSVYLTENNLKAVQSMLPNTKEN